jgi:integrase
MRHGAGSLLLAAGVPIEIVAMILGHASPNITRSVYAHVLRGPARQGMEAPAALVRGDARAQLVHSRRESDDDERKVI